MSITIHQKISKRLKLWILTKKCVNLYLTNYLAGKENTNAVEQINSEESIIRTEDSSKDV